METVFVVSLSKHRIDEMLADWIAQSLTSVGVKCHRRLPDRGEPGKLVVTNGMYNELDSWVQDVLSCMDLYESYYFLDDMTTYIPDNVDNIVSQFKNIHPKLSIYMEYDTMYWQISKLGSLLPKVKNSGIYEFVYWGHYKPERAENYKKHIPNLPTTLIIGDENEWSLEGFAECSFEPYTRDMDKLYSIIAQGKKTAVFGDKFHNGVNLPLRIYEGWACGCEVIIDKELLGTQGYPGLFTMEELGNELIDVLGITTKPVYAFADPVLAVDIKPNTQLNHTTTDATEILSERAKLYGTYKGGVDCRADMLNALNSKYKETHLGESMPMDLQVMFSDVVLKLMRIASDPTHIDSYVDLEGYAKLIKESQC